MLSFSGSSTGLLQKQDPFSLLLLFFTLYIGSLVIWKVHRAFFGPLSSFPGPRSHALSILPYIRTTWNGTDNTDIPALHSKFGEVVRVAPNQLSFVGSAQIWKDIHGFRKDQQPEVQKDPIFYGQSFNRTPNIVISDVVTHARQRKVVSHAFSDKALKEQEPLLRFWADKLRSKLTEQAARGEKTDMLKMLNCTTFDVMGDLTFAEPLYMLENSEYVPWVKTIFAGVKYATCIRAMKMLSRFSNWFLNELLFKIPSLRKNLAKHWRYTADRVDRRLAKSPDRPDLWTRILEKGGDPLGKDASLSLKEHYSIASVFMIAGTETTATALSGAMFYLLKSPKQLASLQEEIRSAFTSLDDMHLEPLTRLPLLEATIKEAIRMYPPVPIGLLRVSPPGGMMVGEHFVPEGTSIAIHHLSTYRQASNFKHAYQFRPERWLGDKEFEGDKLDSFEPFSTGPRNCIGKNLAWHEMRLLLATVLFHFDIELCPESQRWADQKVYSLWEKPALLCKLTPVKA